LGKGPSEGLKVPLGELKGGKKKEQGRNGMCIKLPRNITEKHGEKTKVDVRRSDDKKGESLSGKRDGAAPCRSDRHREIFPGGEKAGVREDDGWFYGKKNDADRKAEFNHPVGGITRHYP